ncbi:FAD-binding oxidoreductase [Pseudomonas aeruginosa]|nr:FAD-binding oxidoreductase [Pseudomonas aeruginosa]
MRDRRHHPANTEYQELLPSVEQAVPHTAGQHVDIRLTAPDGYSAMRSYSIASSAVSTPIVEIAIERMPDAEVSPFFHDIAAIGDEIEVRGPLGGHFLWPEPAIDPVLLIGEAPASCR